MAFVTGILPDTGNGQIDGQPTVSLPDRPRKHGAQDSLFPNFPLDRGD